MKNTMKNIYLGRQFLQGIFVLMMIWLLPFTAAAQVDVHVTILPPYSNKLSDYLSRPQQCLITVHNETTVTQNVQLRGEFTGDNGVSIRSSANYKSSAPIRLSANETRQLNIGDIQNLFDINKITFTGVTKAQFIQDNGVPEGNYQICLQAFDYFTNKPLSETSPSGCSNIFPVISVEDPTLIAPYDEQVVSAAAGQNFVISWSTPAGAPPSTQYTVKIVQMFGNTSPQNAFNTSITPIFFQQTVTGTNSLVYGPAMPAMTIGRHYAIAITAADLSNTVTFKNKGQSVVTSFVYGDTTAVAATTPPVATTTTASTIANTIPTNILSGKVNWYYIASEENAPTVPTPVMDNYPTPVYPGSKPHYVANASVYVSIKPVYTRPPGYTAPVASNPIVSQPAFPGEIPGGGISRTPIVRGPVRQVVKRPVLTSADTLYQGSTYTTTTDADGNFQLSVAGVAEGLSQNTSAAMQALQFAGCDSVLVSIEVQRTWGTNAVAFGPYYFPVSALQNGGSLALGTLKGLALTYRFRPYVTDESGNELKDAVVNIYRKSDFYDTHPQLKDEGDFESNVESREQDQIDGETYTKVATLSSGYVATRLFFNDYATDTYKVQVTEGNRVPITTTLSMTGANANLTGMTIPQTFVMQNGPTTFSGTVFQSIGPVKIPAKGAVISFINNFHQFIGVTDSLGNFNITNGFTLDFDITHDIIAGIAPSPQPITFIVQYNGQALADNVLIDKPYQNYTKIETFNEGAVPVSGKIVDDNNVAIPNPLVKWASGAANVTTDALGNFSTVNAQGTDTLIVSKLGYADRRITVNIAGTVVSSNVNPNAPPKPRAQRNKPDVPPPVSTGMSLANNGNIGNIQIDQLTAVESIKVQDNTGAPVANAIVSIEDDPNGQNMTTDASGNITITGPAGQLVFDVQGPAGSKLVPTQYGMTALSDGVIRKVTITLQQGIKISGKVTANGAAVANATVGMQSQDFGTATTQADGSYSVIMPVGNYALEASKQGHLADIKQANYTTDQTVNFTLTTSGLSLNKLLGFDVEVDQVTGTGDTRQITGSFINIPSNSLFTVAAGTKLRFYNVPVTVQPDKTVVPVDDIVQTSESQINLKAFGYLPVSLTNQNDDQNDAVYVAKRSGNHGQIMGQLGINFSGFMPTGIPPYIADGFPVTNSPEHTATIPVITDDGSVTGNNVFSLLGFGGNTTFNIGGFKVSLDLASSYFQSDGLHLAGSLDLSSIPLLSGSQINIKDFWIDTNGSVKSMTAQSNLSLNIAGWNGQIQSIGYNDGGFTMTGNLAVQIPATQGVNNLSFSNLQLSPASLFGGNFSLPQSGLDVFDFANISGSQITFGQVGNSNVYYLSGAGSIKFTGAAASYVDPINLQQFQVQTDGQFAVTSSPNIHNSFFGGLASLNITQLGISYLNNQPKIDLQGTFGLSIPGVSATAGGIHFGAGGSISVDNLNFGFDVAGIANANVNVSFLNSGGTSGFSGSGNFNVAGFANIGCNFYYYKLPGGFSTGTSFTTTTEIPIGTTGFVITRLGGGFKVNTAASTWSVDINGQVSVGESTFANANIDFSIANGPVIKGSAQLNIAGLPNVLTGDLTIDVPNKLFAVDFAAGVSMAGLTANAGGRLVLSLNQSDKYFLLGTYANFKAFGIMQFSGAAILAYNLNTSLHRYDLANYITAIPDGIKNNSGIFSGISTQASFSWSLDNILPNFDVNLGVIDFGMTSYFNFSASGYVTVALVNNVSPTFAAGFNVDWGMGGEVHFSAVDLIDVKVGLAMGFNAGFQGLIAFNPGHAQLTAYASAFFHAYWGDISPLDCESGTNIPFYWPWHWWISVCVKPSLTVNYDTYKSPAFSMHF